MIAVIDYGRGNLGSVEKAFGSPGPARVVTEDPRVVEDAEAVVLPGDGAFHDAMASLARRGLLDPDARHHRRAAGPSSASASATSSSSRRARSSARARASTSFPARCGAFPAGPRCRTWAGTASSTDGDLALFEGVPSGAHFYFVHSYLSGDGRTRPVKVATCTYGVTFAAAVSGAALRHAVPPEKSQKWGLRLLENFAALRARPAPLAMAFTLIPAIDLRGGRCVRLLQGRLEDETVFSEDPVATARGWQAQGAPRLHVVDLDGASAAIPRRPTSSAPSSPRSRSRCRWAGAFATPARCSGCSTRGPGGRWWAPAPRSIRLSRRRSAAPSSIADHRGGGRRRRQGGGGRLEAGARARGHRAGPRRRRGGGRRRALHRHRPRRHRGRAEYLEHGGGGARGAAFPSSPPAASARLDDIRQLATIPGVEGAIVGRALYSGAVDLRRALAEVG